MIPTVEQWKQLYEAAAEFKRAGCWKWLSNGHTFGVKDPVSGEVGYCCVLGNGGDMFGLSVYLGTAGLETLVDIFTGELDEDLMFSQHCLMLSLDDRDELYPEEWRQIKDLGLKFRGANSWPTFRYYEPGYVPMPLQRQDQVVFLTQAIRQTLEVAEQYKANPDALIEGEDELFLTRVPLQTGDGLVWSSEWLAPEPIEEAAIPAADPIDELYLAKLKKRIKGTAGIWEMDCFFAPMAVEEGEKPYYPLIFLIVDQQSGQILNMALSEKSEMPNEAAAVFLKIVEELGLLPAELWAANEQVFMYISQLLHVFDLQAYLTLELPALEEAKDGMMEMFMRE